MSDDQISLNHELLAKRMIALNQMGCHLKFQDGHCWIVGEQVDEFEDSLLNGALQDAGVSLNTKIYGGLLEALNCVDLALTKAREPTLLELYGIFFREGLVFLGNNTTDASRVSECQKGCGGLG